jgi:hypothetical protein
MIHHPEAGFPEWSQVVHDPSNRYGGMRTGITTIVYNIGEGVVILKD